VLLKVISNVFILSKKIQGGGGGGGGTNFPSPPLPEINPAIVIIK